MTEIQLPTALFDKSNGYPYPLAQDQEYQYNNGQYNDWYNSWNNKVKVYMK